MGSARIRLEVHSLGERFHREHLLGGRSLRSRRRKLVGDGEEGKKEGERRERVRDAFYKNPLLFIAAGAGVRKFLIG